MTKMDQSRMFASPIPAFYINLDRDSLRKTRLEEELSRVGLSAERVSAVDGRAVPNWLQTFYDNRMGPGEVGCSASHLTICRIIVEKNIPFALILEDDARLDNELLAMINEAVDKAPRNWDIIRLIESSSRPVQYINSVGRGKSLVRYLRVPRSTTGLIVSHSGARKLLTPRLIKQPIDVEIRWPWQLDLNVYGIEPPPVTQASGNEVESTIPSRSRPKKNNQLRRMVFNIRKMGLISYAACISGFARKPVSYGDQTAREPEIVASAKR
jgi:glycosyl transferase, family 25